MEAIFVSSSIIPPLSFSLLQKKKHGNLPIKISNPTVYARRRESIGWDYRGGLVDESMIVLRKRIHELKVIERNYEPPREWMEWEKQYYANYDELICQLVGLLQTQLINARPSLALGMIMLVGMSVPISTCVVVSHFLEAASSIFPALHLG